MRTFPPEASGRRGHETWQVRLVPIELEYILDTYTPHVHVRGTYSRYLDRFTRPPYIRYIYTLYFLHCALASLWRYIYRVIELCTRHRTHKNLGGEGVSVSFAFRRRRTNSRDSNRNSGAVTNVQISLVARFAILR